MFMRINRWTRDMHDWCSHAISHNCPENHSRRSCTSTQRERERERERGREKEREKEREFSLDMTTTFLAFEVVGFVIMFLIFLLTIKIVHDIYVYVEDDGIRNDLYWLLCTPFVSLPFILIIIHTKKTVHFTLLVRKQCAKLAPIYRNLVGQINAKLARDTFSN